MNKKSSKNNKNIFIASLAIAIFVATAYYVLRFPLNEQKEKQALSQQTPNSNGQTWEDYQNLNTINPSADYDIFSSLSEPEQNSLHRNFLLKIQKCLSLVLTQELETQLIYNLGQGSSREAVLRGLLSKQEVFELIERDTSPLLTEEITLFIDAFNKQFLQRDDFELPLDMRQYELKVALMEEFLDVADLHLNTDTRKFYLWAAYILNSTTSNFDATKTNQQLVSMVSKIPVDHLKSEVPLAICQTIDRLAAKTAKKSTQHQ